MSIPSLLMMYALKLSGVESVWTEVYETVCNYEKQPNI